MLLPIADTGDTDKPAVSFDRRVFPENQMAMCKIGLEQKAVAA